MAPKTVENPVIGTIRFAAIANSGKTKVFRCFELRSGKDHYVGRIQWDLGTHSYVYQMQSDYSIYPDQFFDILAFLERLKQERKADIQQIRQNNR